MKLKVILHPAEEGGFWAEVPALPGCFSQGETQGEVMKNIQEAIQAYLFVPETQNIDKSAIVKEVVFV